jgi:hypothetical protein
VIYLQLAKKIPDRIRSERLMTMDDPIENAQAVSSNLQMQLLFAIYTEFLFPGKEEDINCWRCLNRIINCFKEMRPYLIQLEKENHLLNSIA